MEDATRAAVHDDRFERQGAACLWTSAAEARPPLGAPLRGEVLWQTPDGYVELERPPEREGGPRARLSDVGRKSTQVLVTKVGPAAYAVSVNGETVALPDARSSRQPVTLTSFEGPYCGADNDTQTVVGPVSLGLLAANGQRPPTSARVTVVQRAMANGDEFFEQVLREAELPCGDAQAASLPVLAVPFPARFTESPFIEVQNVAAERAQQVKDMWDSVKSFLYIGMMLLLFWLAPITATAATALGEPGTYFEWIFKAFVPQSVVLTLVDLPRLFAERVLGTTAQNQESQGIMLRFLATFAAPILRLVRFERIAGLVGQATTGLQSGGDLNAQAASMAQSTFATIVSATEEPYGRKDYHKYTLRAVVRTLRALMAQDVRTSVAQAASLNDEQRETDARPQSVFSDHKNETTMLDYLNEDETRFGEFANWFSGILQFVGLGLFGKKYDATGKAQSGLVLTQVGKPRLRGMDPRRLRVNYVTTHILVDIVDSEGTWKLAIKASAETGFRAGYYASGVAEDVRELNRTIEEFSKRHERLVELLRSDAAAAGAVAQQTAALRESNAALFYSLGLGISELEEQASGPSEDGLQPPSSEEFDNTRSTYRRIKRGVREVTTQQLAKGARKFKKHIGPALTAFVKHNGGLSLMLECDLGAMLAPPVAGAVQPTGLPVPVLRVRPQRIAMDALTYSMSTVDYVGVSLTDQVYEETNTGHPIDGAIDECRRSLQSYTRSLAQLWGLWESRSATRMRWYELFELRKGTSDTFDDAAVVSTVGARRLSYTADGVLFPLEVRDRLEWWVDGRPDPELANAIGLVSTKPPTRYSDTKEAREQAHVSPNGDAEQVPAPKTLAELLAAQAIADCLAARTVARATLPKAMRVSTNATDAVRSMVPRILEVLSACRIDDPTGIGGVLADNDPLFACVPGGIEAARLLHCLGAWRRREDVTLAVNAPVPRLNIDLTRARQVARSNAWPKEAEAQLKAVSAALRRVSVRAFAAMPIYALQNTLAWTEHREADALTARLCEAVASFDRTEQLALELGLAPTAVNPIRLRVVAHWPVVLSARIGLTKDADFRELLTRIAPTVEAWKSLANDRAKPLLGSSGAGILAALAARNARLRVDRAHLEAPDLEGDRAAAKDEPVDRAYFVPFAHGSPPHSHVWSAIHPGSRGLDSVPIGAGYLSRATRDCKAAAPGGGNADAADVTIKGDGTSTHPFNIALERDASERAIRAQCHLVAVTSAEPVGASASPAPLDLGLAAEALVQGTGEAQRGSLVDVIGWNSERLLQAALLALNVNGKCTLIECTPPMPAAPQTELVDELRSSRERDSHTRLIKWEVMLAVEHHQTELRRVYGEAEELRRDILDSLIRQRNKGEDGADNITNEMFEAWNQERLGYFGKAVDDEDFGFSKLVISGADDAKREEVTGAIVGERVATKEAYAKVRGSADGSFMWSEERAKAFRNGSVLETRAYTTDEALKYDCAHVENFVAQMSEEERDENEASARDGFLKFLEDKYATTYDKEKLNLGEADGDRAKLDWDYKMASRQRLYAREGEAGDPELEAARNHVNAKQAEYVEHLSRVKNVEARLEAAKDAQRRLAATLGTRNNDAFHASVALAGAMLKALLGEDRAPRLRVAAGAAPPAWLAKAEALRQDRLLSLFEVALVFDQLVRGAA